MRKLALDAVEKIFPLLTPDEEEALVSSVVSQWITYDGHAVLLKQEGRYFLGLRREEDLLIMNIQHDPGPVLHPALLRDWWIDIDQVPEIVQSLNVHQIAKVTNRHGVPLRVSVNPKERSIWIDDLRPPSQRPRPEPQPLPQSLFCPRCSAVLSHGPAGQTEQRCPVCHLDLWS
jgi:hypothetical protein